MQDDPHRARQGLRDVHRRGRVPAARTSTASSRSPGWSARRPRTSTSARSCSWTAATSSATPPRRSEATRSAHPQHRPPPRQHPLRHRQPRRPGGLVHGRDRLGPDARPRRQPTLTIAEALYVGLITDTGRFMYENTGPRAHLMAAELIEAGVDVHEIYRRVYEGVPYGKLALLARGLANVERYDDGRLTVTALSAQDFTESGAEESYSEGVIDHLRAVEGTAVAALVRDRIGDDGRRPACARSRCAPATTASTSRAIARAPGRRRPPPGGRVHDRDGVGRAGRVPARASSPQQLSRQCRPRARARRRPAVRQARRDHLARRRRAGAPARSAAASRSATPARSTRSRPGCCSCSSAARRASSGS